MNEKEKIARAASHGQYGYNANPYGNVNFNNPYDPDMEHDEHCAFREAWMDMWDLHRGKLVK